jgi:hypothetical protein
VDKHPTIYDLVGKLKVTREKSRKLIYERALRKSSSTDLDLMVIEALKNLILAKDGKFFILEIENPLLLDHLRSQVTKLGFISDGSFSPSIGGFKFEVQQLMVAWCSTSPLRIILHAVISPQALCVAGG